MEYQNLKFLQDTFLKTQHIFSWTLTEDNQLLYSNCPEQEFFFNVYAIDACGAAIREHFRESDMPILASDSIGFVWIAVRQKPGAEQEIALIHLLGPVFISSMTEAHLHQRLRKLRFTPDFEERLLHLVHELPVVLNRTADSYAEMLHYCVNEEIVEFEQITTWSETSANDDEVVWGDARWHGTWISEQRFFQSVIDGRYEGIRELGVGRVGDIGGGDPLRQAKNEMIVFSVLCSRGAILGGVSSEGALNLEDFFIQNIEMAETVPEVQQIGGDMHKAFIERVQIAKANQNRSPLVRACVEYVATNILERIRVKDIADEVGYTENYISRTFKAEMGCSLFEYINRQKIETAKAILRDNTIPIAELSDRLSFSNPSYFISVFKKVTGQTPGEYTGMRGNK